MNELESEYQKIEARFPWPKKPNGIGNPQYYRLIIDLSNDVRTRSIAEGLAPDLYKDRLYELVELVSDLQIAFFPISFPFSDEDDKRAQVIWFHQPDYQIIDPLRNDNEFDVDSEYLLGLIAKYLTRPWMQNSMIEWIFVDALVFSEIVAYRRHFVTQKKLDEIGWGFFMKIFLFPAYYYIKKSNKEDFQAHTMLLDKMMTAYAYCQPPVLSLSILNKFLKAAMESGAMFDGALFAILERIEESNGKVFMPFEK